MNLYLAKRYAGYNDFLLTLMQGLFHTDVLNKSYEDFPAPSMKTNTQWDDYCGMYLMGGEL